MSVSPVPLIPPSAEIQGEQGGVRDQTLLLPGSGTASSGEISRPESSLSVPAPLQDEVKVQMESPGEIAVYQFVNQHGTLILQVPPQQILNLARQISQEMAEEAAPRTPVESTGEDNGR
ncbi:MAG: hypothetical protein ACLP00_18465 [Terracidiphilus sp.]